MQVFLETYRKQKWGKTSSQMSDLEHGSMGGMQKCSSSINVSAEGDTENEIFIHV